MKLNISKEELKQINIKNIMRCLKYKEINFNTYQLWLKNLENYPDYDKIVYKNLINLMYIKNIPIYRKLTNYEPNFIILSSGQSNAGGWDSQYNLNNIDDQVNSSIYSYNVNTNQWVIANLQDNSLGDQWRCRAPGTNLFVFQFAKYLVKNYPGIRPGIINECEGGRPISMWAKFDKNEKYYDEYIRTIEFTNRKGGEIFDRIEKSVKNAFDQLLNYNSIKFDVILWHQGESDYFTNSNPDYYRIALKKVIKQFKIVNNNVLTPFIAGTILNYYQDNFNSDPINHVIRTIKDEYYNYAELSNLKSTEDNIHFTSEATRIGGGLYFEAYEKIKSKLLNKGIE